MEGTNVRIIQVKLPDEFSAYLRKNCPENADSKEAKENQGRSHKQNDSWTQDKMEIAISSVDFIPPFSVISI